MWQLRTFLTLYWVKHSDPAIPTYDMRSCVCNLINHNHNSYYHITEYQDNHSFLERNYKNVVVSTWQIRSIVICRCDFVTIICLLSLWFIDRRFFSTIHIILYYRAGICYDHEALSPEKLLWLDVVLTCPYNT